MSDTGKTNVNENLEWVSLHIHTDYSLLDGMGKCEEYAKKAKYQYEK